MTPARLLRLYPRRWRQRYGDEFLALLEDTPITRPLVIDIMHAAAGEWLARTRVGRVILAAAVAASASVCAAVLSRWLPVRTDLWHVTSFWSASVLLLNSGAPFFVATILMIATTRRRHWYGRLGLGVQVALLFVSTVWSQWLFGYQPGAALDAGRIARAAVGNTVFLTWVLILLLNMDRVAVPPVPLRDRIPIRSPVRPLGLGGDDGAAP